MPWRKCAARLCTSRESWEVCAKATIAAQESAKTSTTTTPRELAFPFLAPSVMIPQPAFRDFSPKGEKPIPPAESKQERDPEGGYELCPLLGPPTRWKFTAILLRATVFA